MHFYQSCFCVYLVLFPPVLPSYDVASGIQVLAVGLITKTFLLS